MSIVKLVYVLIYSCSQINLALSSSNLWISFL